MLTHLKTVPSKLLRTVSLWVDPVACSLGRGEEYKNTRSMGQTSISPFCTPWGKLWVGFTNKCVHTHTKLRDRLTQKLHFKTHLAGSMAVPAACALRVESPESGSPSPGGCGQTHPRQGQERWRKKRRWKWRRRCQSFWNSIPEPLVDA